MRAILPQPKRPSDRKSTRLNSSHVAISYAVFCLKTKKSSPSERLKDETKRTRTVGGAHYALVAGNARTPQIHVYRTFFFVMIWRYPKCSLFPCTTLFR